MLNLRPINLASVVISCQPRFQTLHWRATSPSPSKFPDFNDCKDCTVALKRRVTSSEGMHPRGQECSTLCECCVGSSRGATLGAALYPLVYHWQHHDLDWAGHQSPD